MPEELEHLWQSFLKLHRRRQYGFGANPLGSPEIASWASLSGLQLSAWEFDALCRIDDAVVPILNKPKPAIENNISDGKSVAERMRKRGTVKG
ncbi:MAG: phage tail assembly chaperone [Cypionkella sp.]